MQLRYFKLGTVLTYAFNHLNYEHKFESAPPQLTIDPDSMSHEVQVPLPIQGVPTREELLHGPQAGIVLHPTARQKGHNLFQVDLPQGQG